METRDATTERGLALMNNLAQARRCVLYARLSVTKEESVITRVSKTVMPVRVRTGQVYSDSTDVFAIDDYGNQAVLSSSLHQTWAITYGSTLETRVRYTPSDVFETFPRPAITHRLAAAGRALDEERSAIMLRRDLGLTKTYNLVNDASVNGDVDVALLRDIHVEIDEALVAAYGWDSLRLGHGFHTYRQMERWTFGPAARVELHDRLLLENHRRAALSGANSTQRERDYTQASADTLLA